jgi:hypothetical protein
MCGTLPLGLPTQSAGTGQASVAARATSSPSPTATSSDERKKVIWMPSVVDGPEMNGLIGRFLFFLRSNGHNLASLVVETEPRISIAGPPCP